MAGAEVSEALRNAIRERAKGRCEYCLTSEALSGIRCQTDHILPPEKTLALTEVTTSSLAHSQQQRNTAI